MSAEYFDRTGPDIKTPLFSRCCSNPAIARREMLESASQTSGGSSEKLFAIVHGRKAGPRERVSTFEALFDQQFPVGHVRQCRLVLFKVGTGEAQHLARNH